MTGILNSHLLTPKLFFDALRMLFFAGACLLVFSPLPVFGQSEPSTTPLIKEALVEDQSGLIRDHEKLKLENLLNQHAALTGERIRIVILQTVDESQTLGALANQYFRDWDLEPVEKQNALLLIIDWKMRDAHLRQGIGIESIFSAVRASEVVEDQLIEPLKGGHLTLALSRFLAATLYELGSPLLQSEETQSLLSALKNSPAESTDFSWKRSAAPSYWFLPLLFGLSFALLMIYGLGSSGIHYSSQGIQQDPLWRGWVVTWKNRLNPQKKHNPSFEGGGTHGHW